MSIYIVLCCVLFMLSVTNKPFMLNVVMLNVIYAEYHKEAIYTVCGYAECNLWWVSQISPLCWVSLCWMSFMLSITNKTFMLCVFTLSVVMPNVVAPRQGMDGPHFFLLSLPPVPAAEVGLKPLTLRWWGECSTTMLLPHCSITCQCTNQQSFQGNCNSLKLAAFSAQLFLFAMQQ